MPPAEPVLPLDEIQGNSLAGFKKDFQCFLLLSIANVRLAKSWLNWLVPSLSRLREVFVFNREFKAAVSRGGMPLRSATWTNVAFTSAGVSKLTSKQEAEKFDDVAFRYGLYERSPLLGDPTDPASAGHRDRWLYGSSTTPIDLVVIVASDKEDDLQRRVAEVERGAAGSLVANGLQLVYRQWGRTRRDLPGHEHFGFKDGISQPAVRGRLGPGTTDYFSPRWFDPRDERALRFAAPGQPLVWPGEFVLGLESQSDTDELVPLPPITPNPPWARNGSYVVMRRLRQDAHAFWEFAHEAARQLSAKPEFNGMTAVKFASLMIGRWPSGAPLMRVPMGDDPAMARDDFAANHFDYLDETKAPQLLEGIENNDERYSRSVGDPVGSRCPLAAHIRKANPRDHGTDLGGPRTTLRRLLLRRGVPYGEPVTGSVGSPGVRDGVDRGLVFVSYQASITRQFEFLIRNWANSVSRPVGGGHDPTIGQQATADRKREFEVIGSAGTPLRLNLTREWVTPTAGGYFFSPSITALRDVLGR